jgi:hypothetical protein
LAVVFFVDMDVQENMDYFSAGSPDLVAWQTRQIRWNQLKYPDPFQQGVKHIK